MSTGLIDDQSRLVQVMAWCRKTTRHYLNLWRPRSLSSYGVTRPQWVMGILELYCVMWSSDDSVFDIKPLVTTVIKQSLLPALIILSVKVIIILVPLKETKKHYEILIFYIYGYLKPIWNWLQKSFDWSMDMGTMPLSEPMLATVNWTP